MSLLTVVSPGLKILFDRVGKPEIINRPPMLRLGGTGAVIACNHVGWADSLWMAYAVYPRQLRYMSKEELFGSPLTRWVLQHGGSIPIDRGDPSLRSIKTAVDILQNGEIILIFPSGTRNGGECRLQAGRCDNRASRRGPNCTRLLRRSRANANWPRHAPATHSRDIRDTDPHDGIATWKGNDVCPHSPT